MGMTNGLTSRSSSQHPVPPTTEIQVSVSKSMFRLVSLQIWGMLILNETRAQVRGKATGPFCREALSSSLSRISVCRFSVSGNYCAVWLCFALCLFGGCDQ